MQWHTEAAEAAEAGQSVPYGLPTGAPVLHLKI